MTDEKLKEILKERAPCYLYDANEVERRAKALKGAMEGCQLLYSIKTNPFPPLVEVIAGQGIGADAASAAEVTIAADAGIPAEDIYFSAAGKENWELEETLGRCVLVADSEGELERLEAIAAKRGLTLEAGLRVNPAFGMGGATPAASKFGVDEEDLPGLARRLTGLPHLRLVGVHVHLCSQILDWWVLADYYRSCFELARRMAELPGVEIRFINFGGGVGTGYDAGKETPRDLERLRGTLAAIRAENEATLKARLLVESGRYLVCAAGTYYAPVVDIKNSRGKKFVIVRGGLNGFLRPAVAALLTSEKSGGLRAHEPLFTSADAFQFRLVGGTGEAERVCIAGNLCTAADVLAADTLLQPAKPGDLVEVTNAGSYARSLTPMHFSGHPLPGQYLIKESGKEDLI